uniref:Uncharacterized protein n=1 Tax=Eptatretus burgeri TaxID=7764 RepID=A0A8C4QU61_EPTBU
MCCFIQKSEVYNGKGPNRDCVTDEYSQRAACAPHPVTGPPRAAEGLIQDPPRLLCRSRSFSMNMYRWPNEGNASRFRSPIQMSCNHRTRSSSPWTWVQRQDVPVLSPTKSLGRSRSPSWRRGCDHLWSRSHSRSGSPHESRSRCSQQSGMQDGNQKWSLSPRERPNAEPAEHLLMDQAEVLTSNSSVSWCGIKAKERSAMGILGSIAMASDVSSLLPAILKQAQMGNVSGQLLNTVADPMLSRKLLAGLTQQYKHIVANRQEAGRASTARQEAGRPSTATPLSAVGNFGAASEAKKVSSSLPAVLLPRPDTSTLSREFPVSSGSQHRTEEQMLPGRGPSCDQLLSTHAEQPLNLVELMDERAKASCRLATCPGDPQALLVLAKTQQQKASRSRGAVVPGQFTGSTGVQVLSKQQLANTGRQAWSTKDQFVRAPPVCGGVGEKLLRKMGWREGQGLGRNREGLINPITVDFKLDRCGLSTHGEKIHKVAAAGEWAPAHDVSGKHPVCVLTEICGKRHWPNARFMLAQEGGPNHKKTFIYRVMVNGMPYQPILPSPNKKTAKAAAAYAALQGLGAVHHLPSQAAYRRVPKEHLAFSPRAFPFPSATRPFLPSVRARAPVVPSRALVPPHSTHTRQRMHTFLPRPSWPPL